MRRDVIDNVEIVEPPLEELTKKSSGFKRGCLTGCFFMLLALVGFVIALRFAAGPGPQSLKKVPASFPSDIPVYDPDTIENIIFIPGRYKNRALEIAAFIPKLILAPLFLSQTESATPGLLESSGIKRSASYYWKILTAPVGDRRDTVQIQWRSMDAEPSFVISYYKKELIKQNFKIDVESEGQSVRQFSFSRDDGYTGSLYVQGDETLKPGTDYALLTVSLPITASAASSTTE